MFISAAPHDMQTAYPLSVETPSASLLLARSTSLNLSEQAVLLSMLGPEERRRYAGFIRPERQLQFLIGRHLLRFAIASATSTPAAQISVMERPGNAPQVAIPSGNGDTPYFSLSHSKQHVSCLVSRYTPVGLDIELLFPDRDVLTLSSAAFTTAEHDWLVQHPIDRRASAFYRLWNSKEAWFKLMSGRNKPVGIMPSLIQPDGQFHDGSPDWHNLSFMHADLFIAICSDKVLESLYIVEDIEFEHLLCR